MAKKTNRPKLRTYNACAKIGTLIITKRSDSLITVKKAVDAAHANIVQQQPELKIGCFSRAYLDSFNASLASIAANMMNNPAMSDSDVPEDEIDDCSYK